MASQVAVGWFLINTVSAADGSTFGVSQCWLANAAMQ